MVKNKAAQKHNHEYEIFKMTDINTTRKQARNNKEVLLIKIKAENLNRNN